MSVIKCLQQCTQHDQSPTPWHRISIVLLILASREMINLTLHQLSLPLSARRAVFISELTGIDPTTPQSVIA